MSAGTWAYSRACSARQEFERALIPPIKALFVYNGNPVVVAPEQNKTIEGLSREDLFTVVSDHFITDTSLYADLVLPATTAIKPLGEAVSNTELFRRLAAGMGFEYEWFNLSDKEMALESLDWPASAMRDITMERLERDGWAKLNYPSPDIFAPYAEGNFPTTSGKVELYSSMAAEFGDYVLPVFREGYDEFQDGGPVDPVPGYEEHRRADTRSCW